MTFSPDEPWTRLTDTWNHGEAVAVAADSKDRIFVLVRGPRPVLIFDRQATLLGSWGDGQFVRPHGLFITPDDTVYCIDDNGHSVRAYSTEGKLLRTIGPSGVASDTGVVGNDYRTIKQSAPPFNFPCNLALAPSGDLFICDGYGNARVHRFSADGRLLHSWGEPGNGPGQFNVPHGIAVDRAGTVYVADRENSRIQLFTPEGVYLREWTDVARPCQVYIHTDGLFYVSELGFRVGRWPRWPPVKPEETGGRVSVFDAAGKLHARWGGGANPCAPGDFCAPHGIWVDRHGDVYVTEVTLSAGRGQVPATCHTIQKFVRTS